MPCKKSVGLIVAPSTRVTAGATPPVRTVALGSALLIAGYTARSSAVYPAVSGAGRKKESVFCSFQISQAATRPA